MAHLRERFLGTHLKKALSWSPCVTLLGMRQTGKTTLLKTLGKGYLTFDDDALPARLSREGYADLSAGPFPLILDEVQKFPPVFDRIKLLIDQKRVSGRFLLTGSVRFSSRKAIRESLTGRSVSFELFPLSLAESRSQPPSTFTRDATAAADSGKLLARREQKKWAKVTDLERYLDVGGLPGICFRREAGIRSRLFDQHLDTLLMRDLSLISELRWSQDQLRALLARLSSDQGQPLNLSRLAREIRVSAPTLKKALFAFESLFLVRRLGKSVYVEDQGLVSFLGRSLPISDQSRMQGMIFHELRCQLSEFDPGHFQFSSFETRGGAEVPFVLQSVEGPSIAIGADAADRSSEKTLKSLGAYARAHRTKTKPRLIALHQGDQAYISSSDIPCLPWHWIF